MAMISNKHNMDKSYTGNVEQKEPDIKVCKKNTKTEKGEKNLCIGQQ